MIDDAAQRNEAAARRLLTPVPDLDALRSHSERLAARGYGADPHYAATNGSGPRWDSDDIPLPNEPSAADPWAAAVEMPSGRDPDAPRMHLRDRLLTVSQLGTLPPVEPLVEVLLYRGTLAQIAGQPGSYKSFLTIAIACSVALGESFEGHRVPAAGAVVYVAAEGASGLQARIKAWCEALNADPADLDGRLYVLPVPIQLGNRVDLSDALDIVRDIDAALLVIDTRARCTVGLEENSSTEQGRAIHALEALIAETGVTVLGVHHASRTGTAGRGSNAWDGAVWSDLRVTGEDLRAQIQCAKHKDVPDGCEHDFRLVPHTVAEPAMPGCSDDQRSTLVVVRAEGRPTLDDDPRSGQAVADIVRSCDGPEGLTRPQIVSLAAERGVSRTQAYAAVKALVERGALRNISKTKTPRYVLATSYRSDPEGVS